MGFNSGFKGLKPVFIFFSHPRFSCGPPSLLHNGYRVSFPGVKRPGCAVDHPLPSSAEVKEGVEL